MAVIPESSSHTIPMAQKLTSSISTAMAQKDQTRGSIDPVAQTTTVCIRLINKLAHGRGIMKTARFSRRETSPTLDTAINPRALVLNRSRAMTQAMAHIPGQSDHFRLTFHWIATKQIDVFGASASENAGALAVENT